MLHRLDLPSDGPARPLLIAHGLFGSARNWGVIARRLSDRGPVVGVDMRNHGDSPWFETHSYPEMAADLAAEIDGTWDVLGHSMGGKAAMMLALTQPEKVGKLVVADIAPVAYSHTQMPVIEAMRRVDLATVRDRAEAAEQLGLEDPGVAAFVLQSLDLKARRWRLNLDVLAAEMPKIVGWPEVTGQFDGPALFLSGATSSYVRREDRDRIKALFPNASFARIPGAGHWLHAEKPREVEAAVRVFLDA
jgi:pimeloyl-ACP methyl ester carboxylesterase